MDWDPKTLSFVTVFQITGLQGMHKVFVLGPRFRRVEKGGEPETCLPQRVGKSAGHLEAVGK